MPLSGECSKSWYIMANGVSSFLSELKHVHITTFWFLLWLNTYLTILNQSSLWEWIDLGNKIFTAIRLCSIANSCKNFAGGSFSVFTKFRIWQVKNILQNSHILTISITFTDCRELLRKIITLSKPIYQFIIQDGKSLPWKQNTY